MADFSSVPIPPRNIGAIEPAKPKPDSVQKQDESSAGPSFKEVLSERLDRIQADTDQVAKAAPTSYENVDEVMDAAKNAYSETMQAQHLMQKLFNQTLNQDSQSDQEKE